MPESQEIHVPKTRQGGTFTEPDRVNLHSNDFDWEEKMAELSVGEKDLVSQYKEVWEQSLSEAKPAVIPHCSTRSMTVPVPEPWESHYMASRHHFPLKNYIVHAFPILKKYLGEGSTSPTILECGCGNGSTLLPLMKFANAKNAIYVGFDVSATSIKYFSEHEVARKLVEARQLYLFPYDAAAADLPGIVPESEEPYSKRLRMETAGNALATKLSTLFPPLSGVKYDVVLLIFVLSALETSAKMRATLRQLHAILKPGGVLLFRDYALPDHNFFRFLEKCGGRVSELHFSKGDGTSQVFFDREIAVRMFEQCGFVEAKGEHERLQYHCNRIINRKNGKRMDKIFINGAFQLKG